jgi:serine/alanine adding enzyme
MKVLINNDIPGRQWEGFLNSNSHSTTFQSPAFYHAFRTGKYFQTKAFAISDEGSLKALAVVAVQKEKGVSGFLSARAIIYGGPLPDDDCPQALEILLRIISDHLKGKVIYAETRNLSDYSHFRDIFASKGFTYLPYLNYRIDTSHMEKMKSRVSSSRLRQIRKAAQRQVVCTEAQNADEVRAFYMILKSLYRKKLHKPLPAYDFFLRFYEANLGKYLLVRHDNRIIGGILCPVLPGRALYEFYICGMDSQYKDLYPSVMATWGAMEYACSNEIPLFDFMGAGRPEESYGVRDFKARFGGEIVEYGRFMKIYKPVLYQLGKTGLSLKKIFSR